MTESGLTYHWSRDEFVRAADAGVFDHRVELVNGHVWPVVIGDWHGETVMRLARVLPRSPRETSRKGRPSPARMVSH